MTKHKQTNNKQTNKHKRYGNLSTKFFNKKNRHNGATSVQKERKKKIDKWVCVCVCVGKMEN